MPQTPSNTPSDPLVTKYVEAALDPYRDKMPPEDLDVFRLRLYVYYETNADAVALLDEIRAAQREKGAPVPDKSGGRSRRDETAPPTPSHAWHASGHSARPSASSERPDRGWTTRPGPTRGG